MIQANELRIGNSVFINGEICPSIGYSVIMDVAMKERGVKNEYLDSLTFEPIPITEELIVKYGFEKERSLEDVFVKVRNENSSPFILFSPNAYVAKYNNIKDFYFNIERHIVTITHIHQLQNLYFAITKEELIEKFKK